MVASKRIRELSRSLVMPAFAIIFLALCNCCICSRLLFPIALISLDVDESLRGRKKRFLREDEKL